MKRIIVVMSLYPADFPRALRIGLQKDLADVGIEYENHPLSQVAANAERASLIICPNRCIVTPAPQLTSTKTPTETAAQIKEKLGPICRKTPIIVIGQDILPAEAQAYLRVGVRTVFMNNVQNREEIAEAIQEVLNERS